MSDKRQRQQQRMGDLVRQDTYTPMALDAGILDIGKRRYGPNEVPGLPSDDPLLISPYQSDIRAAQGVNSMVANPDLFRSAVSRMPVSENVEYGKPAGVMDWIRSAGWAVR